MINSVYTVLQKKRNFSEPIFLGDPGSLTLTPGHAHFVTGFLHIVTKKICKMKYTTKYIYLHSSRFFWNWVYFFN